MIVSMTAAATVLLVFGVEEEEEGEGGSVAGYATVVLICFFVFNFAYGWGYVHTVVSDTLSIDMSVRQICFICLSFIPTCHPISLMMFSAGQWHG